MADGPVAAVAIGCGWGSLILYAARHYGVRAAGVTLSAEQRDFVANRIAEPDLSDRVEVRRQNYRGLASQEVQFDAIGSVEMGEHLGEEQQATCVDVMHRVLKPGGRLGVDQILAVTS